MDSEFCLVPRPNCCIRWSNAAQKTTRKPKNWANAKKSAAINREFLFTLCRCTFWAGVINSGCFIRRRKPQIHQHSIYGRCERNKDLSQTKRQAMKMTRGHELSLYYCQWWREAFSVAEPRLSGCEALHPHRSVKPVKAGTHRLALDCVVLANGKVETVFR